MTNKDQETEGSKLKQWKLPKREIKAKINKDLRKVLIKNFRKLLEETRTSITRISEKTSKMERDIPKERKVIQNISNL